MFENQTTEIQIEAVALSPDVVQRWTAFATKIIKQGIKPKSDERFRLMADGTGYLFVNTNKGERGIVITDDEFFLPGSQIN